MHPNQAKTILMFQLDMMTQSPAGEVPMRFLVVSPLDPATAKSVVSRAMKEEALIDLTQLISVDTEGDWSGHKYRIKSEVVCIDPKRVVFFSVNEIDMSGIILPSKLEVMQ